MMITQPTLKTQVLVEPNVWRKLAQLDETLEALLRGACVEVPREPGRDVQILPIRELPPKKGLATREGQARLLHDLASIEVQAMELALRTLVEFPEAPPAFREQLADLCRDEGRHLRLCLEGLQDLGQPWGSFATHTCLWQSVDTSDTLLDRLVIVHRFLEGSGLDASATLLRRLGGVRAPEARKAVETISREEVGHVLFGSRWYHVLVVGDACEDFRKRLLALFRRIPRRLEPINVPLRRAAGFREDEILVLEEIRSQSSQFGRRNTPCSST